MTWGDIYRQLAEIAGDHTEPPKTPFYVYIIKVASMPNEKLIDFYVGSTGNTLEKRFEIHRSGKGTAAAIFSKGRYRPVSYKTGWMDSFPSFENRKQAEKAEGIVAEFLIAQGYEVEYCNTELNIPKKNKSGPTHSG